jgi:hypothetical protein
MIRGPISRRGPIGAWSAAGRGAGQDDRSVGAKLEWPVVVGAVPREDALQVSFAEDQDPVGDFGLAVRTKRSAKQFVLG